MTGREESGGLAGDDMELDALLSAADQGMLDAICGSLDLDAGFAQVRGGLAGTMPPGQAAWSPAAHPDNRADGCGRAPAPAGTSTHPAHLIPDPVAAARHERTDHPRTLVAAVLALVAALNIALLLSLGQSHGGAFAQPGTNTTHLLPGPPVGFPMRPLADGPPRGFRVLPPRRPQPLIIIANQACAFAFMKPEGGSIGIDGHPAIGYLKDFPGGPALLLPGFPAGTAIRLLSTSTGQPNGNGPACDRPLPARGKQFLPGTAMRIVAVNGKAILTTMQDQSNGQIYVIVVRFQDRT